MKSNPDIAKQLFEKSPELLLSSDVTFIVGSERVIKFQAKALIEFIDSPIFKRVFLGTKSKTEKITIQNIEPNPFLYCLK